MFPFSVVDVQFYTLCGNGVKFNVARGEHGTGAYRGWWWFYTPHKEEA